MEFRFHEDILHIPGDVLVKMSTVELDAGSRMEPHIHHTLELSMIFSGHGEYRVGDLTYPVEAGDMVLFNNIESHAMWNTGDTAMLNIAVEFEPRFIWSDPLNSLDQAFLAMFFTRNSHFRHKLDRQNPAFPAIQSHFREIHQEFVDQLPRYEILINVKLLTIQAHMLRYYDMTKTGESPAQASRRREMEGILSYIAAHYAEPLPLSALAEQVHLHPSHFSRVFHAANGLSPREYIIRVRITAATQLLTTTDREVVDIAQACGFNNLSNFYTSFKRITGKSPAQYRAHPLKG